MREELGLKRVYAGLFSLSGRWTHVTGLELVCVAVSVLFWFFWVPPDPTVAVSWWEHGDLDFRAIK